MERQKHLIQILTLKQEKEQYKIRVVGFIFVEDKTQVVFNPSIKTSKDGHWTWHKDGKIHLKHGNQIIFSKKSIPLNKFKGKRQFLFSGLTKDADIHIDYKLVENASIFLIDLRQFTKGLGLSIHVCDHFNVNKATKAFENKPHHQSFVYWKSSPKIVINAFDN